MLLLDIGDGSQRGSLIVDKGARIVDKGARDRAHPTALASHGNLMGHLATRKTDGMDRCAGDPVVIPSLHSSGSWFEHSGVPRLNSTIPVTPPHWGTRGTGPGESDVIQGIAIDANDNIYVADYANERIQVFDRRGNFRREMRGFGAPMAICITPGPNQVMYVSNSNPPDNLDVGGEIYKMELNGTIIGRFGTAGKIIGQFGTVNAIDCREENDLLVGELGNWRVQRVMLQPMR